ncbi:PilZ domain-containing protein [Hoeflea sp. AS16]|uniref:PilZ domain-containing protein n=1 Tax=unclassified Hoeflea TaxID=2614931 RepID=UPI003176ECAC
MASRAKSTADQDGDIYYRSSDIRYGAHCPGIVELVFKDGKHFIALTGVIVNLSVTGCLFSNDKMPWADLEGGAPGDSLFDIIHENCHIYIPWADIHCTGKIRRVGSFIIGVKFDRELTDGIVKAIARLEPGRNRRLSPKDTGRYNRILPVSKK